MRQYVSRDMMKRTLLAATAADSDLLATEI
jgi:hypothetical protein